MIKLFNRVRVCGRPTSKLVHQDCSFEYSFVKVARTLSSSTTLNTTEENDFDIFAISETWLDSTVKLCRFRDLHSSAKTGENINPVATLQYISEIHSKRHFGKMSLELATKISNSSGQRSKFDTANKFLIALFIDHPALR